MPYADTPELRMYYEIAGAGPPLLYISGTGGDLRQTPTIFESALPRQFELLAYDQRGLGRSAVPDGPYTMRQYADDAAALLDAVGWDRCHVLGVSFGGMVAQEFALRHPQRIERMALACTSAGGAGEASYPLHELVDLPDDERARRSLLLGDTRMAAIEREQPERFAKFVGYAVAGYAIGAGEPDRDKGRRMQLEARRHHDTYDRLPSLTMPVYICGGRYDGIAPPSNLESLHRQIAHSQLEMFEGGHLFMIQDKSAWPRIIEFLSA